MNVTQEQFADMLQLSRKTVNEILTGKSSITAETAVKLGALFGNSPQFWSNLQSAYDVWEAEQRLKGKLDKIRALQPKMQELAAR
jgi:addiction module HigA family antidote